MEENGRLPMNKSLYGTASQLTAFRWTWLLFILEFLVIKNLRFIKCKMNYIGLFEMRGMNLLREISNELTEIKIFYGNTISSNMHNRVACN